MACRISYEPEISDSDKKSIIRDVMEEYGVHRDDIPGERKFQSPQDTQDSERYFDVEGSAWFTCPEDGRRWLASHSMGIIDLKKMEICDDFPQNCKICGSEVDPEFTEESIERMAEDAVRQYLGTDDVSESNSDDDNAEAHRSSYEPEIAVSAIKRVIRDIMEKNNVYKDDIPGERKFHSPQATQGSKRYFDVKGFAWFTCPKDGRRWASAHSWGIIDLKKQNICHDFPQYCKKCNSEADPEFTEESIERMADYAVRQYLIRTGQITGFKARLDDDDDGHESKGPHDEQRCGKCLAQGHNCMGK